MIEKMAQLFANGSIDEVDRALEEYGIKTQITDRKYRPFNQVLDKVVCEISKY